MTREPEITRDPEDLLEDPGEDEEEAKEEREEANLRMTEEEKAEDTDDKHHPS